MLGPAGASVVKVNNRYRYRVFLVGKGCPALRRLVADGTRSVLFSTHITSDLEKCATHIAFIKDGEMQYTGSLDDFRDHYKDVGVTLEDIIVHVERRPLDEGAII